MDEFLVKLFYFIIGGAAAFVSLFFIQPIPDGLTCTQQRAISETMPQEFECIQWTKE